MEGIRFEPEGHRYFLGDEEYVSVTQVLAAMRISDNDWIKDEYRQRGTAVHQICDLIDADTSNLNFDSVEELIGASQWEPGATTPELVGYGQAYAAFRVATRFRPALIEERLHSTALRLAGTLDRFGAWGNGAVLRTTVPSRWVLIDLKSGVPTLSARIQTALYQYLMEGMGKWKAKADVRAAVHLQKDGSFRIYRYEDKQDIQVGLSAVNLYHWMKNNKLL